MAGALPFMTHPRSRTCCTEHPGTWALISEHRDEKNKEKGRIDLKKKKNNTQKGENWITKSAENTVYLAAAAHSTTEASPVPVPSWKQLPQPWNAQAANAAAELNVRKWPTWNFGINIILFTGGIYILAGCWGTSLLSWHSSQLEKYFSLLQYAENLYCAWAPVFTIRSHP